jgi:hypothetical protein
MGMILDVEEETQDLDWFGVDDTGGIAHFASGGRGFLPPSVKASRLNLTRLTAFFRQHLSANGVGIESTSLSSHLQFTSEVQKAIYLADYSRMGAKGLYSFDCVVGPKRPSSYFVVIKPSRPLKVDDLPDDIRQILNITHYAGTFRTLDLVNENEFG